MAQIPDSEKRRASLKRHSSWESQDLLDALNQTYSEPPDPEEEELRQAMKRVQRKLALRDPW